MWGVASPASGSYCTLKNEAASLVVMILRGIEWISQKLARFACSHSGCGLPLFKVFGFCMGSPLFLELLFLRWPRAPQKLRLLLCRIVNNLLGCSLVDGVRV